VDLIIGPRGALEFGTRNDGRPVRQRTGVRRRPRRLGLQVASANLYASIILKMGKPRNDRVAIGGRDVGAPS
jgi:hypothetical protein